MEASEIKKILKRLSCERENSVIGNLARGNMVRKSMGRQYEIDDVEIERRLGDFPGGVIPYGPIYRALRNPKGDELMNIFGGSSEVPFSRVYEAGVGECLEKAILVQLAAQKGVDVPFLISGSLCEDGDFADFHAFNIIFRDGKPFLLDVQNPLSVSDGIVTHPYIAPVEDLLGQDYEFKVPNEWRQGRTYAIF